MYLPDVLAAGKLQIYWLNTSYSHSISFRSLKIPFQIDSYMDYIFCKTVAEQI